MYTCKLNFFVYLDYCHRVVPLKFVTNMHSVRKLLYVCNFLVLRACVNLVCSSLVKSVTSGSVNRQVSQNLSHDAKYGRRK